ncbi:excalibur calcium-binding domain-containing protein [Amycolatopsis suaedae]|uniref:excalibur calcium-binding domain-containing protein n=1 Tax=Amycolatopsis suaedae TaxID=2510978 RepID=UPI001F0DCBA2|nr:excalibur calcium-binding domain-containing protein [Amycolatopsis suaedae]
MRRVLIALAAGVLLSACGMSGQDPGAPATRTVISQVTVTQSPTSVTTSPTTTTSAPVVTELLDPPDPPPAPTPKKKATTPKEEPASVYYKNCTEARKAGAAPVYRGDPGYAPHLDRDDDGVGCE